MKKVLFIVLAVVGSFFAAENVQAQQLKLGVFDIELMVQAMPKYRNVDSLVQIYERDSLSAEYNVYQTEYHRLDSTYKADSAAKKSNAILEYNKNQRQQMGMNLVYWQQIAQNKSDQKRGMLAQPIYEQVVNAYKKVLEARKYTIVLKPNTYEVGTNVENVFQYVAKELKVSLPAELGGDLQEEGAKPKPTAPKPGAKQ
jgi:Skp family chaperone for outer membrane proteins